MSGVISGWMARFESDAMLVRAILELRRAGTWRMEASIPFESDEVLEALGARRSRIPWLAFVAAVASGVAAWWILWWTRTTSLPLDVGARPNASSWADIPIIFESTILGTATSAFLILLVASGLPRLRHPWFEILDGAPPGGFWLAVEALDPEASREIEPKLRALGALEVRTLADPDAIVSAQEGAP